MSLTDQLYDEIQESPWLHSEALNGKYVCKCCIRDVYLRKIIKENLVSNECSYCNKKSKKLIGAPLRELIGIIYNGLCSEWEHPEDVLSWDSREGGWQGAPVYDSYDLQWNIQDEMGVDDNQIITDIVNELGDYLWCEYPQDHDFCEDMKINWEYFCSLIKHQYRYTIFQISEEVYLSHATNEKDECTTPKYLFKTLKKLVKSNKKMTKTIRKGSKIYRARLVNNKDKEITADFMGAPPRNKAKASRMSPSGIPLFYCALDEDTAIKEIIARKSDYEFIAVGEYELTKDIDVLNFCDSPKMASLFDPKKRWIRRTHKFLIDFSHEISKKVELDGREHIEYVPTQVITEYFRYLFRYKRGQCLNGILYKSTKSRFGQNCALFINNKNICEKNTDANDTIEKLIQVKYIEV